MSAQRRAFRIERFNQPRGAANTLPARPVTAFSADDLATARHQEILDAISSLRGNADPSPDLEVSNKILNDYKKQMAEANTLKVELNEMYEAITQTKLEIATLHVSGFNGPEMSRVTDELDAIVSGTEHATETILTSAEDIDQNIQTLGALLKSERNKGMADDISQEVIKIFEACNFQDLTGQRISKVINTLRFIEERIVRMMDIWGGLEGFNDIDPEEIEKATGDAALLNGPALAQDLDTASQNDIDAMFD